MTDPSPTQRFTLELNNFADRLSDAVQPFDEDKQREMASRFADQIHNLAGSIKIVRKYEVSFLRAEPLGPPRQSCPADCRSGVLGAEPLAQDRTARI